MTPITMTTTERNPMLGERRLSWRRVTFGCLFFLWAMLSAAGVVLSQQMAGPGLVAIAGWSLFVAAVITAALQPVIIVVTTVVGGEAGEGRRRKERCKWCRADLTACTGDRCPGCGALIDSDLAVR